MTGISDMFESDRFSVGVTAFLEEAHEVAGAVGEDEAVAGVGEGAVGGVQLHVAELSAPEVRQQALSLGERQAGGLCGEAHGRVGDADRDPPALGRRRRGQQRQDLRQLGVQSWSGRGRRRARRSRGRGFSHLWQVL